MMKKIESKHGRRRSNGKSLARLTARVMMAPANIAVQSMLIGARTMELAVNTVTDVIAGDDLPRSEPIQVAAASSTDVIVEIECPESGAGANEVEGPAQGDWLAQASNDTSVIFDRLSSRSVVMAHQFLTVAASSNLGRRTLDVVLIKADSKRFDPERERASLMAVTSHLGAGFIRGGFTFAKIAVHLSLFDTRTLAQVIDQRIEDLNLVATSSEMHELMPVPLIDQSLREEVDSVLDRAPRSISEAASGPRDVAVGALIKEAWHLALFLTGLSRIAAMLGVNLNRLVMDGSLGFGEIEAFLEGRGAEG